MAKYLRYVIKNVEPLRIADDSTSQRGQTNTLRYIPGTTIRGLVIHALTAEENFEEEWKEKLFSKETAYLNAVLMAGNRELFPSPKGFYEDRFDKDGKKKIENVVVGEFTEGYKRAGLGRYSYFEEDCIRYYNVATGSDLKIKINTTQDEKRNVFRNEYIMPGQVFCGYIKIGFPELEEKLKAVFQGCIILGNARSAGLGKCKVLNCDVVDEIPYAEYLPEEQEEYCYMMLLSNTAMRNRNGELCGIDCEQLKERMGVDDLEVERCSTSTVTVQGYNRTWQTKVPSVVMFEQGSVFKLKYKGVLTKERMLALCDEGIGIHRNEGCGRVLFLKEYEKIENKQAGDFCAEDNAAMGDLNEDEKAVLCQAAKRLYLMRLEKAMEHYIVDGQLFQKGTISRSRLGSLGALLSAYRYNPSEANIQMTQYLNKLNEKEEKLNQQREHTGATILRGYIDDLMKQSPEEILREYMPEGSTKIMGIDKSELLSKDEAISWKLRLITELIRYENKKESR